MGHPWFTFQATETTSSKNLYWVFGAVLNAKAPVNAKELQALLKDRGIETRRFFCPIHLQPLNLKSQIVFTSDLKISENLWERGLYFPSGLGNTLEEIHTVIDVLWSLVSQFDKK
jgi:perosamine synthetase